MATKNHTLLGLLFIASLVLVSCTGGVVPVVPVVVMASEVSPGTATTVPTASPTPTNTPQPTRTPLPTAPPCPKEPIKIGDLTVIFHGVTPEDCETITLWLGWANESLGHYGTGPAIAHVFGDLAEVSAFEYDNFQKQWMTYEDVQVSWSRGGAKSYPNTMLLFTGGKLWRSGDNERAKAVLHEYVHIVQYWLYGEGKRGFSSVPLWVSEGHAEYLGRLLEDQNDITPLNVLGTLNGECRSSFGLDLEGNCLFVQGEQMFILLNQQFGEKAFEVFRKMGEGFTFESAFLVTYGITVVEFEVMFDEFHNNGYPVDSS